MTKKMNDSPPVLSVVIPVYNEEKVLPELCRRLYQTMSAIGKPWEVIFVNDGSQDRSSEVLRAIPPGDGQVKIVEFSRNFGHQAAITAGIDCARGDAVVVMDSDLQDPPEILSQMVERWGQGVEVVYAVRKRRKESWFKRACYYLFYRLLRILSAMDIPPDAGDFCLMDRCVADQLRRLSEHGRFVRGLRAWVGFRQESLEYERSARFAGESKYTGHKLFRLALDGIFSFSYAPLRLATFIGLIVSLAAFVEGGRIIYLKLFVGQFIHGLAALSVFVLFLGGIELLFLGLVGEYVGRVYEEVKGRPTYIVKEVVDVEAGQGHDAQRSVGRS
jgi:glycosyltransferase involved in cell wall biosynthesis